MPDGLQIALLLATLFALANPRVRAKVVDTVNSLLSVVANEAPAVLNLVYATVQLANDNERKAKFHLDKAHADISKLPSAG